MERWKDGKTDRWTEGWTDAKMDRRATTGFRHSCSSCANVGNVAERMDAANLEVQCSLVVEGLW